MNFLNRSKERGIVHIPILIAAIALIGFILVSSSGEFKNKIFATLFPNKPQSHASEDTPGSVRFVDGSGNTVTNTTSTAVKVKYLVPAMRSISSINPSTSFSIIKEARAQTTGIGSTNPPGGSPAPTASPLSTPTPQPSTAPVCPENKNCIGNSGFSIRCGIDTNPQQNFRCIKQANPDMTFCCEQPTPTASPPSATTPSNLQFLGCSRIGDFSFPKGGFILPDSATGYVIRSTSNESNSTSSTININYFDDQNTRTTAVLVSSSNDRSGNQSYQWSMAAKFANGTTSAFVDGPTANCLVSASPPPPPPSVSVQSLILAEDSSFTINVKNIGVGYTAPNPVDYTFTNSTFGTKSLYAKFRASNGKEINATPFPATINFTSATPSPYYRFTELQAAFGAIKGQPRYSADYDLNHDGNINITDFSLFKAKQLEGKPIPTRYYRFTELQAAFGAIKGRSSNYNSDYDLNNDNNINITDFSLFKAQNLEGKPIPPTATVIGAPTLPLPISDQLKRADVNHDGKVTSADALLIQRYISGLDKILGRTFGDVNGDGRITDDDAQDVLRIVAGLPDPKTKNPYTQDQRKFADVNNDGQVTSVDALLIQRFAQGLDKVLAKMGDVNGDGQITDADSQAILKIVGGLPSQ